MDDLMDPFRNQHAFYDAQHDEINTLFLTLDDADGADWSELYRLCDEALRDPALPRWYRAKFEAIHAFDPDGLIEEHVQHAKDAVLLPCRLALH
ncbi:hypothetical protein LTR36_000370 [Oleoguttula mirabilis]|uniref:Uncharacterized protein n=1 Tax=Oleoguttula mirabilis TaxID=1507867 RepID=A0AAV9JYU4_9PEZI|nr:hypothetical protein LTR36_000370 [Oleoguttula mirabilis]